jgi:hypothetical protein
MVPAHRQLMPQHTRTISRSKALHGLAPRLLCAPPARSGSRCAQRVGPISLAGEERARHPFNGRILDTSPPVLGGVNFGPVVGVVGVVGIRGHKAIGPSRLAQACVNEVIGLSPIFNSNSAVAA